MSGRERCTEEPHFALARSLLPLLTTGQHQAARENQRRGYPLIRGKREFITAVAYHVITGQFTATLKGLRAARRGSRSIRRPVIEEAMARKVRELPD